MRPPRSHPLLAIAAIALAANFALASALDAQSVLDRSPNLPGTWVGEPGAIHFHFLHRFNLTGPDDNVVLNSPTFLLAAPLPGRTLLGGRWASSSQLAGEQNEWEIFGRWAALSRDDDEPVDLALTAGYNAAAGSADGEVAVGVPLGRLRLLGVGRVFSDAYGRGEGGWAAGGGGSLRITDGIALAADAVYTPSSDDIGFRTVAWSGALQLRVPLTPHTLSLQATNTRTGTLQGSSIGIEDRGPGGEPDGHHIHWGFEFTIPFTFSRYFGGGDPAPEAEAARDGENGATVTMTEDLRYAPATVRIQAGETVRWRNTAPVIHTVTAVPGRADDEAHVALPEGAEPFDSGDLRPDEIYAHTFTEPGEYTYFCVPHEAGGMVGRVIVSP